jgi:hypothetical protein
MSIVEINKAIVGGNSHLHEEEWQPTDHKNSFCCEEAWNERRKDFEFVFRGNFGRREANLLSEIETFVNYEANSREKW